MPIQLKPKIFPKVKVNGSQEIWQILMLANIICKRFSGEECNKERNQQHAETWNPRKKRFLVQLYISTCPRARLGCLLLTHQSVYESKYYKWAWKGLTYFTACLPSEFGLLCVRLLYHQTVLPIIFYIDGKIFNKLAHAFKKK